MGLLGRIFIVVWFYLTHFDSKPDRAFLQASWIGSIPFYFGLSAGVIKWVEVR
jgi:hypothetical protein